MTELVNALRRTVRERGIELGEQDAFELVMLACMACCTQIDGGNKTCPPKKIEEIVQA